MPNFSVYLLTLVSSVAIAIVATPKAQATYIQDLERNTEAKDLHPVPQPTLAQEPSAEPQAEPASTAIAGTERPSRDGFYVSVSGDARFATNATISPLDIGVSLSPGFGINTAVGYRFKNNLRVEGEFAYGSNHIDEVRLPTIPGTTSTITIPAVPLTLANPITTQGAINIPGIGIIPAGTTIPAGIVLNPDFTTATPIDLGIVTIPAGTNLSAIPGFTTTGGTPGGTTTVTTPAIPATTLKVDGKISTLSGLVNLYYDFPTGTRFEPYVGGGVGVSSARADDLSASYPGTLINYSISGSSTVFVYQLRAGVAYHIDSNSSVSLGYRYFNVAKQSFDVDPIGDLEIEGLGIHNIELGFRYRF